MYCEAHSLVKNHRDHAVAVPLRCKRWTCENCQPIRQAQLKDLAKAGAPNTFITLTVNPAVGADPVDRANRLRDAFQTVARRAKAEAKRNPLKRPTSAVRNRHWNEIDWQRVANRIRTREALPPKATIDRSKYAAEWRAEIAKRTEWPRQVTLHKGRLPFLAVFELTERGEPHIHIATRSRWIAWEWLRREMEILIGAPIVFVERIRDQGRVAAYVSKYMSKAPQRFEGCKRYWRSQDYVLTVEEDDDPTDPDAPGWRIVWRPVDACAQSAEAKGFTVIRRGSAIEAWPP